MKEVVEVSGRMVVLMVSEALEMLEGTVVDGKRGLGTMQVPW